jgi:hypothetical protein
MKFDQSTWRDVVALVGWRGDRVAIRSAHSNPESTKSGMR